MNNVSIDEVGKRPLSSVENGSIKKNSSSKSTIDNIDSASPLKTSGMSKDIITINNTTNTTDGVAEDGDGSEAETVVMPGNELDSTSSKKTIRHEGVGANGVGNGIRNTEVVAPNGASTKPSRSNRQAQEGTTSDEKKYDKHNSSRSPHDSSPTASSTLHDHQQQDQQHQSRSRATSESTRSRHDNNDSNKSLAPTTSRKRKVSIDGMEDKSVKRRIKREELDGINTTDHKKPINNARSESPARQRTSTGSANSPIVQKPRRKQPPTPLVVANGKRKRSVDVDSNSSQSPKHSGHPKLTHATDSEMLKRRRDKNGRTRVARACAVNNFEEVREHLKDHPEELDEPDNAGNTPLQIASLEGNTDIVRLLLKKGCKADTENCDRDSPLIDSVENSHLDVVRLLLEAGVNPRKVNAKGEEPSELVDMDHENGQAIKDELAKYRIKYDSKRRQSTEKGPDTGRESVTARSPRGSPLTNAKSPPPQTTRRRAGRSEATRNDLLWITATPENLVNFAGKGDDQAIMHLLNMRPISDVEAVLAAAKGGHDSCLNLLLAMGKTDPDPAPLEDQKKGYNTPMLAAIGKGTPRIVVMLLEQPGFDPTKRLYKNQTYYEIAEKRQGDGWREEYRKLKTAYDEKMARDGKKSTKSSRTSSPKDLKKPQKDRSPSAIIVRDPSPSSSRNGLIRKKPTSDSKPERPREKPRDQDGETKPDRKHLKVPKHESREGSHAISDGEASSTGDKEKRSFSDHEAVPRPRKRLVSGRDLKDAQIKQRRSSFVSTVSTSSAPDSVKVKSSPDDSSKTKRFEPDERKEKKKVRRSISPQPSNKSKATESITKRPRINSDSVAAKSTSGPAKVASMTRNTQSSGSAPVAFMSSTNEKKVTKSSLTDGNSPGPVRDQNVNVDSDEKSKHRIKEKPSKNDSDKRKAKQPRPDDDGPRLSHVPEVSDGTADLSIIDSKIKQEIVESPTKESVPELKDKKVASRSISPDPSAIIEDDAETAPTESGSTDELEKVTPQIDMMAAATEDALNEKKRLHEQEEAESHKRKREDDEASRIQAAEEQKQRQERQRYLSTLPRVFQELMANPENAKTFIQIRPWLRQVCATGIEVDSACPMPEENELWITNFQVVGLLVDPDLELSQFPNWTRKPLIEPLKRIVWRSMRSMINRWDFDDSVDIMKGPHGAEHHAALTKCEDNWFNLHTFWVRLSDFESVVSQYPHLHERKRYIVKIAPVRTWEATARKIEEQEKKIASKSIWQNWRPAPATTQSADQSNKATATQSPKPSL